MESRQSAVPDFIAVCVPLIFGTLRKPAEHPISAPPGKMGFGIDCQIKLHSLEEENTRTHLQTPKIIDAKLNTSHL